MTIKALLIAALLTTPAFPALAQHAHGTGDAKVGSLTITAPFARATPPGAPVAGGFFTIVNAGPEADRLTGGSTTFAGRVEVHEMAMDGGVMKMRELAGGLEIPAGQSVELKPGGYHIMFMDLKEPLVAGEARDVTLTFEKAGDVVVHLPVMPLGPMMRHGG